MYKQDGLYFTLDTMISKEQKGFFYVLSTLLFLLFSPPSVVWFLAVWLN